MCLKNKQVIEVSNQNHGSQAIKERHVCSEGSQNLVEVKEYYSSIKFSSSPLKT